MTQVRLKPTDPRSEVEQSTTEALRSLEVTHPSHPKILFFPQENLCMFGIEIYLTDINDCGA